MPSTRIQLTIGLFLILQLSVWQWSLSYEHFLSLSGYLAINFMSITLFLASRPAWLETPLAGLDNLYVLHRWTGLFALLFSLCHWLIEMADDIFKAVFGRDRVLEAADFDGILDSLQGVAEDLGEPSLYTLLALITITLVRWIPYYYWRYLHRVLPIIYLALVAHALLLAPLSWWQHPIGWLMALMMGGGIMGSMLSLTGQIGRRHRHQGHIQAVNPLSSRITEVICEVDKQWPSYQAGQFALVTFDSQEGAHPFTLSSAERAHHHLSFHIKALGDYTRRLPQQLRLGQSVTLEGPYGRFNPEAGRSSAQQIWVAGGIGITPFLAVLEQRLTQSKPSNVPVSLHYCTTNIGSDPLAKRVQQLAQALPEVVLYLHDSQQGQRLTVDTLAIDQTRIDLWYCGPKGLAQALYTGLTRPSISLRFHQETFELR